MKNGEPVYTYEPFPYSSTTISSPYITSTTFPSITWDTITSQPHITINEEEKEEDKVKLITIESNETEYAVACEDESDLSADRVLFVLSALKNSIMENVKPFEEIKEIKCRMTPTVKDNIVTASKKLNMYGKTRPIIPCWDRWGHRLPDEIQLGTERGVAIDLLDSNDYGKYYFELRAKKPQIPDLDMEWPF